MNLLTISVVILSISMTITVVAMVMIDHKVSQGLDAIIGLARSLDNLKKAQAYSLISTQLLLNEVVKQLLEDEKFESAQKVKMLIQKVQNTAESLLK